MTEAKAPDTNAAKAKALLRRHKRPLLMLGAALVLALVCTLLSWPGIYYSDSYGRWQMARDLTRLNFAVQDDWLSVPPQLFMAVVYYATGGSYAAYAFLQAACFFFTAFFAVEAFVPGGRAGKWFAWILFAACPVLYGFSVYLEMSVGCVTALLWLLWLLLCVNHSGVESWKPGRLALYFFACCFLYFVMLGWRQNALTVLPVLFFALMLLAKRVGSWRPLALHAAAVVLVLAGIAAIPKVLHYGYQWGGASGSVGFLWETVSMLAELPDKPEYDGMLDYLGGAGTTQSAVAHNSYDSIYGYHADIPNSVVGTGGNAARIRRDYLRLMWEQPGAYFTVKGRFIARTLGFSATLATGEYNYDRDSRMAEFGFWDSPARMAFYNSCHGFLEIFSLLRRPWVLFALAAAALLGTRRALAKKDRCTLWILYAAAAFYYGAFLITTQSQEFRYFFPSLVLLTIVLCGSAGALLNRRIAKRAARNL